MKKTALFFVLVLLNSFSFSCSSDDDSEQQPNLSQNKLVKTEKISDTRKVNYTYNTNDLLSSLSGTYNSFEYASNFTYDLENKLTEWNYQESGSSSYSDNYTYTYNSSGLLASYSSNTQNVSLDYNGNVVTLTGTIQGNTNSQVELILNNNGLITKLTESNKYTNFSYDSNGNLISAKSYNNSNNLLAEFTLQYDTKINPFYGQLKSIYIERFIESFWDFDGIYISGFEGYYFPFQKNNVTVINEVGGETVSYNYLYDSDNHPTNVSGSSLGFDIVYY